MKFPLSNPSTSNHSPVSFTALRRTNFAPNLVSDSSNPRLIKRLHLTPLCSSNNNCPNTTTHFSRIGRSNQLKNSSIGGNERRNQWNSEIRNPTTPPCVSSSASSFNIRDHAFLLLFFMASATSMAFISLVVAAVPTLFAIRRAALSFAKLVKTADLELPKTMASIRLSSMEISDLTLELNDLKQDILQGVSNPGQAVQASEAGAEQIGGY